MVAPIARSEHLERQRRAAEAAAARGLDGLLVWSQRSNHGDVTYLTGHRTSFPELADTPHWSGKSYSGFVLPVSGDPVLVVDVPIGPDDAAVDEIRIRIDLVDAVAEALAETGLDRGALGLVGSTTLRHTTLLRFEELLGRRLDLRPADDVVMAMRLVKSPAEIELMRAAADVGAECMNLMLEAAVPGATEGDLIGLGFDYLARNGACPGSVVVASGNPCVPRGARPNVSSWDARRRFEPGDLMRLDFSAQLGGYQTDHARSTVIGADPTPAQRKAMEDALAMITTMIEATKPGITIGQLHDVGATWLAANGYPPYATYNRFWPSFGHGLGLELEPPYIEADEPTVLEPGVILSIETILGTPEVGGATYEDSVLVTGTGAEALTAGTKARWWS
jgi:Xaa-Pro aminopeptidase